jgi:hypothetical protein
MQSFEIEGQSETRNGFGFISLVEEWSLDSQARIKVCPGEAKQIYEREFELSNRICGLLRNPNKHAACGVRLPVFASVVGTTLQPQCKFWLIPNLR